MGYGATEHYRSASTAPIPKSQRISLTVPSEVGPTALKTKTGWPVRPRSVSTPKIRAWRPRLPSEIAEAVDMKALREMWQGTWLVSTRKGPTSVWVIKGRKRSVYSRNSDGELTLQRTERFDLVSPCAVGSAKSQNGNLPVYKAQSFSRMEGDEIWMGSRGVAAMGDRLAACIGTKLSWMSSENPSADCQEWSGSSDHIQGLYVYEPESEPSCTVEAPDESTRTYRLQRQESLEAAEAGLITD